MITASLEHDHDFAGDNNYARGDGAAFGYPALGPSPSHPVNSKESLHYPGGAVLAFSPGACPSGNAGRKRRSTGPLPRRHASPLGRQPPWPPAPRGSTPGSFPAW